MTEYREPSIGALRDVVANKQSVRFRYGANRKSVLVDLFTASAIIACFDAIETEQTREKMARLVSGNPAQFLKVANLSYKLIC